MPLEREMLPDRPEARERFLRAFRVAKAAHATLMFARQLMAVLGSVVQSGCSLADLDKHSRVVRINVAPPVACSFIRLSVLMKAAHLDGELTAVLWCCRYQLIAEYKTHRSPSWLADSQIMWRRPKHHNYWRLRPYETE
jgi:hypothetical protein